MRIGANNTSFPCRKKHNARIFEECKQFGFDLLELNLNSFPVSFRKERHQNIRNLAKVNKLEICVHSATSYIELCHEDKFFRELSFNMLKANLMQAEAIGAKYFIVHVGKYGSLEDQISALGDFVKFSKKYTPKILFENSASGFGSSESDIERVLESLKIDMNLDIGHLWLSINKNKASLETIDKFRDKIKYSHVHSNYGRNDDHLPLNKGNLPIKQFIKKLMNTKVECFTFECIFSSNKEMREYKTILENLIIESK